MNFLWIDWLIVAVYVCFSFLVGLYVRSRIKNRTDFLVAGRKVRFNLGVASLVGTELGLVTMMYMAEEGYRNGFI